MTQTLNPATTTRADTRAGRAAAKAEVAAVLAETCEQSMFRSSDEVSTTYLRGITDFGYKKVEYSALDGLALFEGDIVLGTLNDAEALRTAVERSAGALPASGTLPAEGVIVHGVGITGERFRWPGGLVPFTVQAALRPVVTQAIQHWELNTRIRFVERTAANQVQYPNWVAFEALDGCYSSVGMQGGGQVLSLGAGCGFGAAVHEIGHAVGLWHEQSREDRDGSIRVRWENIQAGREHNFNQHIADGDDIGIYDFGSIMHYGATAFSSNGQPTIETLGGQAIGQRTGLSAGDIAAVRALYPMLEPSVYWQGVQFSATVAANATQTWFTHSWPSYWYVLWNVVPKSPAIDGPEQIETTLRVTRQSDKLLKYFLQIRNLQSYAVEFEARFTVLGWQRNAR